MEYQLEKISVMTEHDRELFARALNTLFTSTFIIKRIDRDRELYRFVTANFELFETYLSLASWQIRKDEHLGVISCAGPGSGRNQLNLDETLSLLVMRLLYEEKQQEINLSGENIIRQYEFHEKFKVLTERMLNKTRMRDILHRFKLLKLIDVRGDETDPETVILLYPSISFVLDSETIDEMHDRIKELTGQEGDEEKNWDSADAEALRNGDAAEGDPDADADGYISAEAEEETDA